MFLWLIAFKFSKMVSAFILEKLSFAVQTLNKNFVCWVFGSLEKKRSSLSQQILLATFKFSGLKRSKSTPIGLAEVAQAAAFAEWLMLKKAFFWFFKKGLPLILNKFNSSTFRCFLMQNAARRNAASFIFFFIIVQFACCFNSLRTNCKAEAFEKQK